MTNSVNKITLKDLSNDTFFNSLRNSEFCLVLGAGFSYGLKNKINSEFEDEKYIPLILDFISLSKRKFNTDIKDHEYQKAADLWKEKCQNDDKEFANFKNLFLLDEDAFEKSKKLYENILEPKWANIYTFNFDNVLDILILNRQKDYDVQYYYVGKFSPDHKRNIGYLHNSILKANNVDDLVFTIDTYADKINNSDNHLYFSIFNDVEYYKKNILIIGSSFDEQSLYNFLLTRLTRSDIKIIHINYSKEGKEPYFTSTFREKVKDISWVNCKTVEFLKFISDNLEAVSQREFLPKFVERLTKPTKTKIAENLSAQSFNDFLSNQYLIYYSRARFKHNLKDELKKEFLSENDLIKYIIEENYYGLIIHGQGGIGKTRLMLELGKRLMFDNFIVLKILPDFENFDELVEYINLRPDKKYLLLVDYIEEQKVFDKTLKWIISNKLSTIKIIGNCRNTIVTNIQNSYFDYVKFIDISFKNKVGLEKKIEQDYKREVILSIINSISDKGISEKLKEDNVLKTFYQARPSFAAFIKYIHFKNPQTDLSISTDDTFSHWLIKKLKITVANKISYSEFFETKKHIFKIFSCLPTNPISTNEIEKLKEGELSYANEITRLIHDGWIDETNQSLKIVHDTVNDSLLLEYFKYFSYREHFLIDFLEFALTSKSISSMMWSLQRVWDEIPDSVIPLFQKNIVKFIDDNFNEILLKESWFKYKLDNTHLISELDRIDLIIKHKELLKEIFSQEKLGSSLAYSMEWIYENISEISIKQKYSNELYDLFRNYWNLDGRFNDFVEYSRGGKIISSYINLFGIDDFIKERFNEYLFLSKCNPKNLEPLSLAIVSWFNKNGDISQKLTEKIAQWFVVYDNEQTEDVNPYYLIECCFAKRLEGLVNYKLIKPNVNNLITSGNYLTIALLIEKSLNFEIKTNVLMWFEIYERESPVNINPINLALAWLEKGDDSSIVRNIIQNSLVEPNRSLETKAKCIGKWLSKSDDIELVKPFIEEILSADIFYKSAYHIIGHWLEKNHFPLLVKPFLSKWLNNIPEPQIFSFIFQSWLIYGDDPNIIIDPIKKWLPTTKNTNAIANVFIGFICSNGNIFSLKSEIIEWLESASNENLALTVLSYLLEKNNHKKLLIDLEIPAEKLFKNFSLQKEIGFSLGYWIEKGGRLSIVEPYINAWLKIFGNSKQASIIIRSWLEKKGKVLEIKEFVIPNLEANCYEKELSRLMFNWIEHGDDPYFIKEFIQPFFEKKENQEFYHSRYLIMAWLTKTNLPLLVKDAIKPWLAVNFSEPEGSLWICNFWLQKGDDITIIEDFIKNKLIDYANRTDCFYIINLWISQNGNIDIIKPSLIKYLGFNYKEKNAISLIEQLVRAHSLSKDLETFVFKIIDYKGFNPFVNVLEVNDNIISFNNIICVNSELVKEQKDAKQLSVKIKESLIKGEFPEVIKSDLVLFLTLNGNKNYASHVLAAWIEYGNDFELIKYFLLNWLENNLNEQYLSSFVLSAALENSNGFNVVHDKAIEWLNYYGKSKNAKFLLSSWVKLKGKEGSAEIEHWIIYWVENLYNPANHNWRDDLLINYCND